MKRKILSVLGAAAPLPPSSEEAEAAAAAVTPTEGGRTSSVTAPHSGASRLPCIAERFWQTLAENPMRRHATIKMCRDPRHTFIFHVPEGRASYAEGVLHVPQARFICGAKAPHRATFPKGKAEHCVTSVLSSILHTPNP